MLTIKNLQAKTGDTQILKGINLEVKAGEVHAIMGPNGSGKSTLSKVIAGHPDYEVTSGEAFLEVDLKQKDLFQMEAEERARNGIFLGFQYPIEVPGLTNSIFLRTAFNEICKHQGVPELDPLDFEEFLLVKMKKLGIDPNFKERFVNVDFSGGEKKRNEILQLSVLNPRLAFLDETDSGLDVDSLRIVGEGVNQYKNTQNAVVLVTHYQRLLDYIVPDYIHVLVNGKIIKTGDKSLALEIEKKGYDFLIEQSS